ncbi:MAG: formate/nitrite transporter family protein [Coriobacteriales bacterium]|nr:formate/nitrite transporter family protein [Coriobacteriales bacterium]
MADTPTIQVNTPAQVSDATVKSGIMKANLSLGKMCILAFLAGAFIAFGAEASSVAAHNVANVGLQRLVTGVVFPVGLIMIVLGSGELFTGNCLMVEALLSKEIGWKGLLRNWCVVWLGNLVGSLFIVLLVAGTTQWGMSSDILGAFTIKIAYGKATMGLGKAFCGGILCNILVCMAVLLATAAKDVTGKVLGVFIPICAFVLSGFEHSVANMFYIPAGMVAAANPAYAAKACELYGYTTTQLQALDVAGLLHNLIPVTLGNIVGGVLVGAAMWALYQYKKQA